MGKRRLTREVLDMVEQMGPDDVRYLFKEILRMMTQDFTLAPGPEDIARMLRRISGVNVLEKTRRAEVTKARAVFCKVLKEQGYSQREIGDFLMLNHSTVCLMQKKMEDALILPDMFSDYVELYDKLNEAINE